MGILIPTRIQLSLLAFFCLALALILILARLDHLDRTDSDAFKNDQEYLGFKQLDSKDKPVVVVVVVQRELRANGIGNDDHLQLRRKNFLPKRYVFGEEEKEEEEEEKKNVGVWIIGFVVGVTTGVLLGFLFSLMYKLLLNFCIRGREEVMTSSITIFSQQMIKRPEDLAFLQRDEDGGLASLQIIGRGGCGEVYKAELPGSSNGKMMIAIKKIIQPQLDMDGLTRGESKLLTNKMRQIRAEIQSVGQVRHRNILSLLAHVSRPDSHYLVYEYMENGSLHDLLNYQVSEGTRGLNWLLRHKISIGIAAGLEYLHMNHNPRIIHRDLKPANVLLDDDFEARIADFGLAKAITDAHTHATTSNVAGTLGFIAPEYHQTLKFTDKCDIYSLGVLLAVLVMGKYPSDEFFQHTDEMRQVKWLQNVMASENPRRAIDPKLIGNGYEDQMLLVLKIACFCSVDDPNNRPNSRDVRHMLSEIKHD